MDVSAVRCSVLQCVAVRCSALQCVAVCCNVLQYVEVRSGVLQCRIVNDTSHGTISITTATNTYMHE